jgi:hypothetical protein
MAAYLESLMKPLKDFTDEEFSNLVDDLHREQWLENETSIQLLVENAVNAWQRERGSLNFGAGLIRLYVATPGFDAASRYRSIDTPRNCQWVCIKLPPFLPESLVAAFAERQIREHMGQLLELGGDFGED